jgi:hypothetical protein
LLSSTHRFIYRARLIKTLKPSSFFKSELKEWSERSLFWFEQLSNAINLNDDGTRLVLRTFYLTKDLYMEHIDQILDDDVDLPYKQQQKFTNLPEHLWVTEFTLPDVYTGNHHKIGDVVRNANGVDQDHPFSLIWMPGSIFVSQKNSSIEFEPALWWIKDHVDFYHFSPIDVVPSSK